MAPVRVGFLGAGTVSWLHASAIAETPGIELAAVYDPRPERAEALAAAYGVETVPTSQDLIGDDRLDAVFVLTPTHAHVTSALTCLDAGKHVLVEKPVDEDPAAIRDLSIHARRVGRVAVPGHNYLHLPECTRLVRYVRDGRLGKVRALFITYTISHPEDLAAQYDGVLAEVMVHHAYLGLAILGSPDRVHGGTSRPGWTTLTADDQAWMTWEYSNGALAQMFGSFAVDDLSDAPGTFSVKALGTKGTSAYNWRSTSTTGDGPFRVGMPLYEETYRNQCVSFRDAVILGTTPLSTLDDAADAIEIISTLRRQVGSA
jgi:predicted dehydrogenase